MRLHTCYLLIYDHWLVTRLSGLMFATLYWVATGGQRVNWYAEMLHEGVVQSLSLMLSSIHQNQNISILVPLNMIHIWVWLKTILDVHKKQNFYSENLKWLVEVENYHILYRHTDIAILTKFNTYTINLFIFIFCYNKTNYWILLIAFKRFLE